jgi:hypothetical protein
LPLLALLAVSALNSTMAPYCPCRNYAQRDITIDSSGSALLLSALKYVPSSIGVLVVASSTSLFALDRPGLLIWLFS